MSNLRSQLTTQNKELEQKKQNQEQNYWQYYKIGIEKMFQPTGSSSTNSQTYELYKKQLCDIKSTQIKRFIIRNIYSSFFTLNELKGLSLAEWPNLTTLVLNSSSCVKDCLSTLCRAKWEKLQRISLQNIQLKQNHMKSLKQFLQNWPNLIQLNLNDNRIELQVENNSLLEKVSKKIQILFLNNNNIHNKKFQSMIWGDNVGMLNWQNLQLLSLKNNNIGQKGIRYMIKNNTMHTKLQKLILSGNRIGNMGVLNLSKIYFPQLLELYIEECGVSDDGLMCLQMMRLNNIICLDFDKNNINSLNKINIMARMEFGKQKMSDIIFELKSLFRCKYQLYL